jgi:hypothetical protein
MKDVIFDDFQNMVSESLVRHKSIIDVLSKLQETEAKISRGVCKSVTSCGCIAINAQKQKFPSECTDDMTFEDFHGFTCTHIDGSLCDNCREVIEKEIGDNIFYLASLCNLLDLNMYDILLDEYNKMKMLGKYHLK